MKIISSPLPANQYIQETTTKTGITLHHTVSGDGVAGDINWWKQTAERVGTPFVIDRKGNIYQTFDEKYWIHHLGIKSHILVQAGSKVSNNTLNQRNIGIELDNWGGLIRKNGKWYTFSGAVIPDCDVAQYQNGYRGFAAFEKYTEAQIKSLEALLLHLAAKYAIPLGYNETMWELSPKALGGAAGIWSHVSYRPDKSDCHPQIELIEMLKSLPLKLAKKVTTNS